MSKIIKYEEVKTYIENSGYKLISNEYISAKSKLTIEDSKGYLYVISFDKIKQGRKPRFADNLNPYTIQNIRLWCRLNNKPFELVDCAYINNRTKLKWKKLNNECGEIFEMNWHNAYFGLGKRCRSNFNVNLSDSLFANCLKIALMWHPDKNGNLTLYNVICGSDKKVWWQCSYGHEWVARI